VYLLVVPPESEKPKAADLDRVRAILRRKAPVWHDDASGHFVLTRHDDVRTLLADRSLLRDPAKAAPESLAMTSLRSGQPDGLLYRTAEDSILTMDDPDHSRIRVPLAKAFYKRVAAARGLVEEAVGRILQDLAGRTRFDAMTEFCIPVPIDVIARILGAEPSLRGAFRSWSVDVFENFNPARTPEQTERMITASNNISGYLDDLMKRRRESPEDDLTSDMMQAQASGTPLTDDEIRENLANLLVAGNLSTTDLIGNGLWLLHTHPAEKKKLLEDPALITNAVEEILRYEPPAEGTARIAPRDMEIRGCPIKRSQVVVSSLRGANRDPEAFVEPDRFDISRKHLPHVSFGGGSHICIGAPLARMEAQVALSAFLRHFPAAALEGTTPAWRPSGITRGLSRIDIRV
jgi:cytochrome P450